MSEGQPEKRKSLGERVAVWVGAASTIATITLAIWNAELNREIRILEADLRAKEVDIEASKERVARYRFVRELFSGLLSEDPTQRALTVNLARLALKKEESEKFFSGIRLSEDKELKRLGEAGLEAVRNEELVALIDRLNASSKPARLAALSILKKEYISDSKAVDIAIDMYDEERIDSLSAQGRINGIKYLNSTKREAWNIKTLAEARDSVQRIEARHTEGAALVGDETRRELERLKIFLDSVGAYLHRSQE